MSLGFLVYKMEIITFAGLLGLNEKMHVKHSAQSLSHSKHRYVIITGHRNNEFGTLTEIKNKKVNIIPVVKKFSLVREDKIMGSQHPQK